jgi:hypothetical protein
MSFRAKAVLQARAQTKGGDVEAILHELLDSGKQPRALLALGEQILDPA